MDFDRDRFVEHLLQPRDARTALALVADEADLAFAIACVLEPIRTRDPATPANETLMRAVLEGNRERGDVLAVVRHGGERAGFLWTMANGPPSHTEIYLSELSLWASARGAGLGRMLLARLEEAARVAGAVAIDLDYMANNPRVRALYLRAGYEQVGVDVIGTRLPGRVTDAISLAHASELHGAIARAGRLALVSTFARPAPSSDEVREEITSAFADGRLVVARQHGQIVGMASWQCIPSKTFGDVVCIVDALDADAALAPDLVDAICGVMPADAAARVCLTVREPSADVVATLVARGLRVHRYKLAKRLTT